MSEWIKVEDQMPEDQTGVLAYFSHGIHAVYFFADGFWDYGPYGLRRHPSHWMSLPAPPEELGRDALQEETKG